MAIKKTNYGIFSWLLIAGGTLCLWLLLPLLGVLEADSWYQRLPKPPIAPPREAFYATWIILSLMIGTAAWQVHRAKEISIRKRRAAIEMYLLQLAILMAWPWAFFSWQKLVPATILVFALVLVALITQMRFWRIRRVAGIFFLPYMIWISLLLYANGFALAARF